MNKVVLMGRLTRDPETRYTSTTNTAVTTYSLAVNRRFSKPGEERQADFINIVAWDKLGEFCSKYFKKGQQVSVVGRIQTRNYDDKDGKKVYVTEVVAEEAYFADTRRESEAGPFGTMQSNTTSATGTTFDPNNTPSEFRQEVTDDDLPF